VAGVVLLGHFCSGSKEAKSTGLPEKTVIESERSLLNWVMKCLK
jgi:hypothetical protein